MSSESPKVSQSKSSRGSTSLRSTTGVSSIIIFSKAGTSSTSTSATTSSSVVSSVDSTSILADLDTDLVLFAFGASEVSTTASFVLASFLGTSTSFSLFTAFTAFAGAFFVSALGADLVSVACISTCGRGKEDLTYCFPLNSFRAAKVV